MRLIVNESGKETTGESGVTNSEDQSARSFLICADGKIAIALADGSIEVGDVLFKHSAPIIAFVCSNCVRINDVFSSIQANESKVRESK